MKEKAYYKKCIWHDFLDSYRKIQISTFSNQLNALNKGRVQKNK